MTTAYRVEKIQLSPLENQEVLTRKIRIRRKHFGVAEAAPHEMDFNNARFIGYVVNALALAGDEGRGKLR